MRALILVIWLCHMALMVLWLRERRQNREVNGALVEVLRMLAESVRLSARVVSDLSEKDRSTT